MTKVWICILGIFCLLFTGCSWQQAEQTLWPEKTRYHSKVTERWTRQGQSYSGIQTTIRIRATYKGMAWRESFVRRWDKLYGLSREKVVAMLDRQRREFEQGAAFIVALSSSRPEMARLDWSHGLWSLQLSTPGERFDPVDVRELDWPEAKLSSFFPYFQPWQNFYQVQFEPVVRDGPMQLILGGPGGPIVLQWDTPLSG